MRKIFVAMIVLMVMLLPSCASEEEKEMKAEREKYAYILDEFADVLKNDDDLSKNDIKDMNEMISIAKTKMVEAETLDEIQEAGQTAAANLTFMAMFVLTEDEFMDYVDKIVDKYPDLESYLLG